MSENTLEGRLVNVKAFNALEAPVIVTSGESLTPFFVNTEKLLEDNGAWEPYGDNREVKEMLDHSKAQYQTSDAFRETIDTLVQKVTDLAQGRRVAFAGGERRDWPFAGIVADKLGADYIVLYKDNTSDNLKGKDGQVDIIRNGEIVEENVEELPDYDIVIPIADLITTGSSIYSRDGDVESGWIPMLRSRGATVEDVVSVVSRVQGGEEILRFQGGVNAHSLVYIDEEFFRRHVQDQTKLENCVQYKLDPRAWTESYLINNGIEILIETFNTKEDRAIKFTKNYREFLEENDLFETLSSELNSRYKIDLEEKLRDG